MTQFEKDNANNSFRFFLNQGGDTMTGDLNMNGNKITNLPLATADTDAASKVYVDTYCKAPIIYAFNFMLNVNNNGSSIVVKTAVFSVTLPKHSMDEISSSIILIPHPLIKSVRGGVTTYQTDSTEMGIYVSLTLPPHTNENITTTGLVIISAGNRSVTSSKVVMRPPE